MVAQSIASRPRRPQQAEPDDVVLARALQFADWAKKNVILISVAAVVIVVLVAGLFWYRTDQERRMENAALAFLQVEQTIFAGDDAGAERELQLFIQQHGGTPYAEEARVLLGQLYIRQDTPEQAIPVLQPVAERMNRSPVGVQGALLLASAQEAAGDTDAALRTNLSVADGAEQEFRRHEALLAAARIQEEAGNDAGAADLYRRLVQMTEPGSADRSLYEMRLAEAEARATLQ